MFKINDVKNEQGQVIMSQITLLDVFGYQLRIHRFFLGDGEWYHSHPRSFVSICIMGSYEERILEDGDVRTRKVKLGTLSIRDAKLVHNVLPVKFPCITLAVTTPVIRKWEKIKI